MNKIREQIEGARYFFEVIENMLREQGFTKSADKLMEYPDTMEKMLAVVEAARVVSLRNSASETVGLFDMRERLAELDKDDGFTRDELVEAALDNGLIGDGSD